MYVFIRYRTNHIQSACKNKNHNIWTSTSLVLKVLFISILINEMNTNNATNFSFQYIIHTDIHYTYMIYTTSKERRRNCCQHMYQSLWHYGYQSQPLVSHTVPRMAVKFNHSLTCVTYIIDMTWHISHIYHRFIQIYTSHMGMVAPLSLPVITSYQYVTEAK